MSWVRHRDIHLLTVGRSTYTSDQRFQVEHIPYTEDWALRILYPGKKDSGIYECQISTTPPIRRFVYLTVVGKCQFFNYKLWYFLAIGSHATSLYRENTPVALAKKGICSKSFSSTFYGIYDFALIINGKLRPRKESTYPVTTPYTRCRIKKLIATVCEGRWNPIPRLQKRNCILHFK